MSSIRYRIVEHDGGWAYQVGGTYSETFPSHDAAFGAAQRAACKQLRPGETTGIVWEDAAGQWHAELSRGGDRPSAEVIE